MPMPFLDGKCANYIELTDNVGKVIQGGYDRKQAGREVEKMSTLCGACGVMTTANSMCLAAEALGMTLPGNGCISAVSSELLLIAYQAGRQIMQLLADGITARKIITPGAMDNAIAMTMAMAGSTNLFMHLPAIANEAGLHGKWWAHFDRSGDVYDMVNAVGTSCARVVHSGTTTGKQAIELLKTDVRKIRIVQLDAAPGGVAGAWSESGELFSSNRR